MRGLTSSLWPIRYKPLPDELLSNWIVRLAHGHGLKVQTFCNLIFGNKLQIWNRDIDRTAPTWLLDELSYRTGTSAETTWSTTLRSYEGLLFRKFRLSSNVQWILAFQLYHRKPEGHGLQFCPACLREDAIPYFRKCWRVAFNTVCTRHRTMMHDRCPRCSSGVAVHRVDMRNPHTLESAPLSYCHSCGFDLRDAPDVVTVTYDPQAFELLLSASLPLESSGVNSEWDLGRYCVMHQLTSLMISVCKHVSLREFVLGKLGISDVPLRRGRLPIETRSITERHHVLQLTAWLLVDAEERLTAAWCSNAVRYNLLMKDFDERPGWYENIVKCLLKKRARSSSLLLHS
jgi:hypothetical protein